MENYELYIDTHPRKNKINGHFLKGHVPFNKGLKMTEWMDGRKIRKVKKYLELGRKSGNLSIAGSNRIAIVGIKDGKMYAFESSEAAERILRAKGVKVNSRNIRSVCAEKLERIGKYSYVRKKAGGFRWFFADNINKYQKLITLI